MFRLCEADLLPKACDQLPEARFAYLSPATAAYVLPLPKGWRPAQWRRTGIRPTCAFMPSEVRPDGSAQGPLVGALFSLN